MDPNELLLRLVGRAQLLLDNPCSNCWAELLAEDVLALHEWLSKGGFPPKDWDAMGILLETVMD